jgi:hypothetical protein
MIGDRSQVDARRRSRCVDGLMRTASALASAIAIACAAGAGNAEIGRIHVFGDSYLNAGEITPSLQAIGVDPANVWSAAASGAPSFDWSGDPPERRCVAASGYAPQDCTDGVHQMRRTDGACRHWIDLDGDSSPEPSCVTDQRIAPQDFCVIQFGTNDVGRGVPAGWESVLFAESRMAFEIMLAAADAEGLACVVATPFPLIEARFYPERDQNLRSLRDWQIAELMPAHPNHLLVDLIAVVDDYREAHDDAAANGLYHDCMSVGGQDVPGPLGCRDGLHPGYAPNALGHTGRQIQGDAIAAALLVLEELPEPDSAMQGAAAILTLTLTGAWRRRKPATSQS